jgi:hypothetical protein
MTLRVTYSRIAVAGLVVLGLWVAGVGAVGVLRGQIAANPLFDLLVPRPAGVPQGARAEWDIKPGIVWRKCVTGRLGLVEADWTASGTLDDVVVLPGAACASTEERPPQPGLAVSRVGSDDARFMVTALNVAPPLNADKDPEAGACRALAKSGVSQVILDSVSQIRTDNFGAAASRNIAIATRSLRSGEYRVFDQAGAGGGGMSCDLDLTPGCPGPTLAVWHNQVGYDPPCARVRWSPGADLSRVAH